MCVLAGLAEGMLDRVTNSYCFDLTSVAHHLLSLVYPPVGSHTLPSGIFLKLRVGLV